MDEKRILMIGEVDFSKDDAPKVHFLNLAVNFSKLGWKTKAIMYSPEKELCGEEIKSINMNFVPNPLLGNKLVRIAKYLLIVPLIIVKIFSFKPQIIYFRFSPPAFLYLLSIRLYRFFSLNYKVIIEFNDWVSEQRAIQNEREFKVKIIEYLQVKSVHFSDYVRVITTGIKEKLLFHGTKENKISVIGNGTDINHFTPIDKTEAKKEIGLNPEYLCVGFIGNFAIWQGLDYLIQAIPNVLKAKNNVNFILVGDGPEMQKINNKVSQFRIKEVILTGRVSYKEAGKYINAFDIGIAPFIEERNASIGLSPLKIRDYAACGVPIITSRIAGLEMVEEENIGILVPPNDSVSLSKAIIELLNNTEKRKKMGKKGRKIAEQYYSWNKIANQIFDFIWP